MRVEHASQLSASASECVGQVAHLRGLFLLHLFRRRAGRLRASRALQAQPWHELGSIATGARRARHRQSVARAWRDSRQQSARPTIRTCGLPPWWFQLSHPPESDSNSIPRGACHVYSTISPITWIAVVPFMGRVYGPSWSALPPLRRDDSPSSQMYTSRGY
jgi:hypothetical protein